MTKETLHELIWLVRVYRTTQNAYKSEKDPQKRNLEALKKAGKEADAACESIRATYLENADNSGFIISLAGKLYIAYTTYRNRLFDYLSKKNEQNLDKLRNAEKEFTKTFNAVSEAAQKL